MNKKREKIEKQETKKAKSIVKIQKKDMLKEIQEKAKKLADKYYIGYTARVVICAVCFLLCMLLSFLCLTKTFQVEEAKVVNYQETGSLDYKVYLKPNEFYEEEYIGKGKFYIASIIKNITVDMNYQFIIEQPVDTNLSYQVVAKLSIAGDQGKNTLYEKEYILVDKKLEPVLNTTMQSLKDSVVIDYDYYNELANRFKATFGVDASSSLTLYVRITKSATNASQEININETSSMNLTIPLTQKTLDIQLNDTGINSTKSIVKESKVNFENVFFGVLCFVIFILAVAFILKTLELLFVLVPKKSKYDKYIERLIKEYDRLIVETPSSLRTEDKEIIKINKFEELLDARDNLKRPIMYHILVPHQKCQFYIESDKIVYLLTIKETDIEKAEEVANKK